MVQAVARHRQRMKSQGLVRVEVQVHKEDASLVRSVAQALSDPERSTELRSMLQAKFPALAAPDFKTFLESAPLDGIDLTRSRDMGRAVDL